MCKKAASTSKLLPLIYFNLFLFMRSVFFPLGQIRAACEHKPQETELHWESGIPQQAARMPPPARHSVCLRSECAALEKSPGPRLLGQAA